MPRVGEQAVSFDLVTPDRRQALVKLPEALRSVFVLYEVNGLRYREIAATIARPEDLSTRFASCNAVSRSFASVR